MVPAISAPNQPLIAILIHFVNRGVMIRQLALLALSILLSACSSTQPASVTVDTVTPRWRIHHTGESLQGAGPVRIDISLATLTAQLLTSDNRVIAEMDVSPGMPSHKTPLGKFRILEKLPLKRSNLYGQYVTKDSREVIVARAWEHKGPRPKDTVYQGIAMPFWLRLTDHGVGMHVGGFQRGHPSSHGCIRCPEPGQLIFYERARIGTPVHVHDGSHPVPSMLDAPPASTSPSAA